MIRILWFPRTAFKNVPESIYTHERCNMVWSAPLSVGDFQFNRCVQMRCEWRRLFKLQLTPIVFDWQNFTIRTASRTWWIIWYSNSVNFPTLTTQACDGLFCLHECIPAYRQFWGGFGFERTASRSVRIWTTVRKMKCCWYGDAGDGGGNDDSISRDLFAYTASTSKPSKPAPSWIHVYKKGWKRGRLFGWSVGWLAGWSVGWMVCLVWLAHSSCTLKLNRPKCIRMVRMVECVLYIISNATWRRC